MAKYFLTFIFVFSCSTGIPKNHAAKKGCKHWDLNIDSAEEFLCAIQFGEENSTLVIQKEKLTFTSPIHFEKSLHITTEGSDEATLEGLSFDFRKHIKIRNVSFVAKGTIKMQSADLENLTIYGNLSIGNFGPSTKKDDATNARLTYIDFESPFLFRGKSLSIHHSRFRKSVDIKGRRFQLAMNRFDGNVKVDSIEKTYINNNLFMGLNRQSEFSGEVFLEYNCRSRSRLWKENEASHSNFISDSCRFRNWCSVNTNIREAIVIGGFNTSRVQVGDFDGDGKDELLRFDEKAWHHYDFSKSEWSFLHEEKNTPPWALGIADLNGDGRDEIIKADGYLIREWSISEKTWIEGAKFEEGFARQYLMMGNIKGDSRAEFVKYDKKTKAIYVSGKDKVEWEKEIDLPNNFYELVLLDYNGNGFADLIVKKEDSLEVYDFTKSKWKRHNIDVRSLVFGHFDKEAGLDAFLNGQKISMKKKRFKRSYIADAIFVADIDGDGVDEIFTQCEPKPGHTTIKIMTYNINHAGVRNVEELAKKIQRLDADFVAVQEVDRNTRRNPYDMAEQLARLSNYKYHAFFKSNDYQGGEYGLLFLSKHAIENIDIEKLPKHKNEKEWSEKNIAVALKSGKYRFLITHIISRKWRNGEDLSETQDAQLDALLKFVKEKNPDFLLGDFNMKATSSEYKHLVETSGYRDSFFESGNEMKLEKTGITFPDIHGDPRRIDYIFMRKAKAGNLRIDIPALVSSDHYPYILEFED